MKKIISTTLIFGISLFTNLVFAQEVSKEKMRAFQTDNVETFKNHFSKEEYDKCFNIKENSYNLLAFSVKYERKNIFNYLLENNVNVNKICGDQSPLMVAARYGKADLAKILLKKGADKNLRNEEGETAKDLSVKYKHSALTTILK